MTSSSDLRSGETPSAAEVEQEIYQALVRLGEGAGRQLGPDTSFQDLGLSSLVVMTLAFELEDRWNITIPTEYLGDFRTVAEARDAVLEIIAKAKDRAGAAV